MVNQRDVVDLDLEPGDILLVWELEVIDQNIEKYIHPAGLPSKKRGGLGKGWR